MGCYLGYVGMTGVILTGSNTTLAGLFRGDGEGGTKRLT